MKNLFLMAAATITLFMSNSAQALDCANVNIDQTTMNQCAHQDWERADLRLNNAYQSAKRATKGMDDAYVPAGEKPSVILLRDAQRAWIKFRDGACTSEAAAMRGGSAQPTLYWGCMARLTRQRTEDLDFITQINQ